MNISNQVGGKYEELLSIIVTRADDKRVIIAIYDNKIGRTMKRFTLCSKCKLSICRKLKLVILFSCFTAVSLAPTGLKCYGIAFGYNGS